MNETRDVERMNHIMEEREKELQDEELQPLDAEGIALTEHKKETFDVVTIPGDPLR